MNTLNNKVALNTGSSRGIGAAVARVFAQEGAKVVLNGRDPTALSAVREEIARGGGKAMQAAADVTKFNEMEAMRRQVEEAFGPIDILVANAGGNFVMPGPLEETSEEGWGATVDANLTATFLTSRAYCRA